MNKSNGFSLIELMMTLAVIGVLAALAFAAFRFRTAWLVIAAMFVAGIGFEEVQDFLLGRTFNPMDVVANGVGLVVGGSGVICFKRLFETGGELRHREIGKE